MFSVAAGMPLMLASTAAEAKASKAAVHYRDYPSGMRMCHIYKFYIAAGGRRSGMGCMGGSMMGMMGAGSSAGDLVIHQGKNHPDRKPDTKRIAKPNQAAEKCNPITWKKLGK